MNVKKAVSGGGLGAAALYLALCCVMLCSSPKYLGVPSTGEVATLIIMLQAEASLADSCLA